MRKRYAIARSAVLLAVPFAVLFGACSEREPFRVDVIVPALVQSRASELRLSLFRGEPCESFTFEGGRPDRVRSSTATLRRASREPEGLGEITEQQAGDLAAIEVRAVDQRGTPLAHRCVTLTPDLVQARFQLAPLAPAEVKVSIQGAVALRSGDTSRAITVETRTLEGAPLDRLFVSSGASYPLAVTDAMGRARIETPTTAPGLDVPLVISVYGVAGTASAAQATVLRAPECPRMIAAIDLGAAGSGGAAGGSLDLAIAGDRLIASSETGTFVLAPDRTRGRLLHVASATASPGGAIAASTAGSTVLIARALDGGRIEIRRYDPAAERFGVEPIEVLEPIGAGPARASALAFASLDRVTAGGLALFAAHPSRSPPLQRFVAPAANGARFGEAEPALERPPPSEIVDLLATGTDLAIVASGQLSLHAMAAGGVLAEARPERIRTLSGPSRIAAAALRADHAGAGDPPDLVLASTTGSFTVVTGGAGGGAIADLDETTTGAQGPTAVVLEDASGDGRTDAILSSQRENALILLAGDARGHFVRATACPGLDTPTDAAAIDLDGDASRELVVAEAGGRLVVFDLDR